MSKENIFQRIVHFFLTKILVGIAVVGGSVALIEWAGNLVLLQFHLPEEIKSALIGFSEAMMALLVYILLYARYEKRKINELSLRSLPANASLGFSLGFLLQSLFILVIWIAGGYMITKINPAGYMIPACITAFNAGFVAEILIRGIVFRIIEEKFGTVVSLFFSVLMFALMHLNAEGASILSVAATSVQAGFLLSAMYVYSRNLWLTIFFHFAWDFTEPGIYGAINPGNSISNTLFESRIYGSALLTGGTQGPGNSIQSLILCLITGIIFLWLAQRNHQFINPRRS